MSGGAADKWSSMIDIGVTGLSSERSVKPIEAWWLPPIGGLRTVDWEYSNHARKLVFQTLTVKCLCEEEKMRERVEGSAERN